jgi:hypothetical protein
MNVRGVGVGGTFTDVLVGGTVIQPRRTPT